MPQTPKANLFIVGAMKCGTHSMFKLFEKNPNILTASFKEPCHFIAEEAVARRWPAMLRYQPADAYAALFQNWSGERYLCEASTSYTKKPDSDGVAGRLHDYNPEARIIYVVREPMRRAVSHYFHDYRGGRVSAPLLEALRDGGKYVEASDYAMQIEEFIARFGRDQVKIVVAERFRRDPVGVYADVLNWLGLPPQEGVALGSDGDNHVTPSVIGQPNRLLRATGLRNGPLWNAVRDAAPRSVRDLAMRVFFKKPIRTDDYDRAAVAALIGPAMADARARFRALTGDPIPEWPDAEAEAA